MFLRRDDYPEAYLYFPRALQSEFFSFGARVPWGRLYLLVSFPDSCGNLLFSWMAIPYKKKSIFLKIGLLKESDGPKRGHETIYFHTRKEAWGRNIPHGEFKIKLWSKQAEPIRGSGTGRLVLMVLTLQSFVKRRGSCGTIESTPSRWLITVLDGCNC